MGRRSVAVALRDSLWRLCAGQTATISKSCGLIFATICPDTSYAPAAREQAMLRRCCAQHALGPPRESSTPHARPRIPYHHPKTSETPARRASFIKILLIAITPRLHEGYKPPRRKVGEARLAVVSQDVSPSISPRRHHVSALGLCSFAAYFAIFAPYFARLPGAHFKPGHCGRLFKLRSIVHRRVYECPSIAPPAPPLRGECPRVALPSIRAAMPPSL